MTAALKTKIRNHLDRTGQSVRGFERAAGLKINVLRNILNGLSLKPTAKTLGAIAKAMNCSVPALLDKEEKPFPGLSASGAAVTRPDLFVDAMRVILQTATAHNRPLTVYKACLMLDEIYAYTMDKKIPAIDEEFIRWFVLKNTSEAPAQ